jgi:hypothetical protein
MAEAVRLIRSAAPLKLPESATQTNTSMPFNRSEENMDARIHELSSVDRIKNIINQNTIPQ